MRVLVAAQIVSGAGLAADVTVGALLAQDTVAAVIIPALLTARNR